MAIPTDILKFFDSSNMMHSGNNAITRDVSEFLVSISASSDGHGDMAEITKICERLLNKGYLFKAGNPSNNPIIGDRYLGIGFDQTMADYGSYDFIGYGFVAIRNHFKESVRPIIVKTLGGIDSIGTCFLVGKDMLITARHCIEGMSSIKIPDNSDGYLIPENVYISKDSRIDIAVIKLKKPIASEIPTFRFGDADVLDEILTIGYPPIAGFDAIQFVEKAMINAKLKSSTGELIAKDKSYLDSQDYFLINARVKGGNSGAPVINELGEAAGMLVNIPTDPEDSTKLDVLGYGVAIPKVTIENFLADIEKKSHNIISISPELLKHGFKLDNALFE
ncbi:S1 family peptidase [Pedobacter chitinilyticus]|uniref:Serine protease n=1 Tax=Pedobacter chitinilyticus TaxID=2233776 RepID=A0A443YKM3_9SPHI|nr:serine protease [Pedobacter chitinilyticus]RWU04298.1 serine protease [Pedobacter chitinilyticus]